MPVVALPAASGPAEPRLDAAGVEATFDVVGQEGGDLRAAGRDHAERQADAGAAQPRRQRLAELRAGQPRPAGGAHLVHVVVAPGAGGHVEHLAEGQDGDGHGHEGDAVEQLRRTQGEALGAGHGVDPDDGDPEPQHQCGEALEDGVGDHRGGRDEREQGEREVLGRAEVVRELGHHGGEEHHQHGRDHAADERADRRGGQRLRRAPRLGHLVALEGGGDRGGLPRGVHEDRHRGVAEHAAEVHAGEHDERGRGVQREGQRQQQRHRHGGAQAGQHAHRGAEQTAQQHPQQVHRGEGSGEALHEESECVHVRIRLPGCPRAGSGPGPRRTPGRPART